MLKRSADQEKVFQDFVQNWLSLLEQNQFEHAVNLLDEPNSYGHWWTVGDLRAVLQQSPGNQPLSILQFIHFTPGRERVQLFELDEKRGCILEYTTPLRMSPQSRWRELALRFEFRDKAEGYNVVLEDIRVI